MMNVTVPPGVQGGMMQVNVGGQIMQVQVPAGVTEGMTFQMQAPAPAAPAPVAAVPQPVAQPTVSPAVQQQPGALPGSPIAPTTVVMQAPAPAPSAANTDMMQMMMMNNMMQQQNELSHQRAMEREHAHDHDHGGGGQQQIVVNAGAAAPAGPPPKANQRGMQIVSSGVVMLFVFAAVNPALIGIAMLMIIVGSVVLCNDRNNLG